MLLKRITLCAQGFLMRPRSLGNLMRKTLYGTLGGTLCGNLMRNLRRTLCGNSCGPPNCATLDGPYAGLRRALYGP